MWYCTAQIYFFVNYKFHRFVKILILQKIKFADCKHNLATWLIFVEKTFAFWRETQSIEWAWTSCLWHQRYRTRRFIGNWRFFRKFANNNLLITTWTHPQSHSSRREERHGSSNCQYKIRQLLLSQTNLPNITLANKSSCTVLSNFSTCAADYICS